MTIYALMDVKYWCQPWAPASIPNCHFGVYPAISNLICSKLMSLLKRFITTQTNGTNIPSHPGHKPRSHFSESTMSLNPPFNPSSSPGDYFQIHPKCIHFSPSADHHPSPWPLSWIPTQPPTSFLIRLRSVLPPVAWGSLLKCKLNSVFSAFN